MYYHFTFKQAVSPAVDRLPIGFLADYRIRSWYSLGVRPVYFLKLTAK